MKLRIAVADDELDMREYFRRMLPRMGHEVVAVADNGRQLVELCETLLPDLVITDIKMPELDGLTAARQLHEQFGIPAILVTAHQDDADINRAVRSCEIAAVLVKPIKQSDLEPAIRLAIDRGLGDHTP